MTPLFHAIEMADGRTVGFLNQFLIDGQSDSLGTGMHLEFVVDVPDVGFNCVKRHKKLSSNHFVGLPIDQQL